MTGAMSGNAGGTTFCSTIRSTSGNAFGTKTDNAVVAGVGSESAEVPATVAVAGTVRGIHCLLELTGCSQALLNDEAFIRQAVTDAAAASGSTLLSLTSHAFSPCGVTALGLLAESHLSIHTWPENGYAAIDIFTCGTSCHPADACTLLKERFKAVHSSLRTLSRGNIA